MNLICKSLSLALLLSAGIAAATSALAQSFPSRPITWIYPFGPSAAEAWARVIAGELTKTLGQPVVIENRPGAGGRLGTQAIMNGRPDGHLISVATTSMLVYQPLTSATFKAEPVKDYAPVVHKYNLKLGWYATTALPFRDLQGLLAYARANPGKLNGGSTGVASTGHVALELLNAVANIRITHVPYKSEGDQVAATLAGDLHLFLTSGGPKPQVDAGKLQLIASTGDTRWRTFPDKPTMREAGLDYVFMQWMGVIAPPGTPADIVAKLNQGINEAMKTAPVLKAADVAGIDQVTNSTPEQFANLIRSELKVLEPMVARSGIKTD